MNDVEAIDILSLQETPEEPTYDFVPKTFDDYLGQAELKAKLEVYSKAAKMRSEPVDHMSLGFLSFSSVMGTTPLFL